MYRSKDWTIYELPHATPLLTGPAHAQVTARSAAPSVRGVVAAPGRYLLRARYSPYLRLQGVGCVREGPGSMTWLQLDKSGAFTVSVPNSADGLFDALTARHHGPC